MVTKFNVSMSPDLYERFEAACKDMGVTRSAFIAFAVSQMINSQRVATQLPELLAAVDQLQQIAAQTQTQTDTQTADDTQTAGHTV